MVVRFGKCRLNVEIFVGMAVAFGCGVPLLKKCNNTQPTNYIKKTMIIKPATSFLVTDTGSLLVNDVTVILTGMANNVAIYDKPYPSLADVQIALDNYSQSLTRAADGSYSARAIRNNMRLLLVGLMRQLANYVAVACKNDLPNLLLSGFPIQKPVRQPIGILAAPTNVQLKQGRTGEVFCRASGVFGASIYNWQLTNTTSGLVEQTQQTPAASCSFTGLTPGVIYSLTVNAVGTAGPSDWSGPATLMVI